MDCSDPSLIPLSHIVITKSHLPGERYPHKQAAARCCNAIGAEPEPPKSQSVIEAYHGGEKTEARLSLAKMETPSFSVLISATVRGGLAAIWARTSAARYLEAGKPLASARRLRAFRSPGLSRIVIRSVAGASRLTGVTTPAGELLSSKIIRIALSARADSETPRSDRRSGSERSTVAQGGRAARHVGDNVRLFPGAQPTNVGLDRDSNAGWPK
jgi:hypothetical protein